MIWLQKIQKKKKKKKKLQVTMQDDLPPLL